MTNTGTEPISLAAVFDDHYEAAGCPGGPGHPGLIARQFIEGAAAQILEAQQRGRFNDLRPAMLSVCQCGLVELIWMLAAQLADKTPTIHDQS
jgi:hypothetical protein